MRQPLEFTLPPAFLSYRAGLAGSGAFTSRSPSTLRTSKLIHKIASATPNKNAASTNHGQR